MYYKIVDRPKMFGREVCCTKAVLVGNHREFIIKFCRDQIHVLKNMRVELELAPVINITQNRFMDQSPVAVNKKNTLCCAHNGAMLGKNNFPVTKNDRRGK